MTLPKLFTLVRNRALTRDDARTMIKTSYFFGGENIGDKHPDVHIVLSSGRPPNYVFAGIPKYNERKLHTMFTSMNDAADAIAAALNSRAGEAALRFLSVQSVSKVGIYSRSAAKEVGKMLVRTVMKSGGASNTTEIATPTELVVVVLSVDAPDSQDVHITTAYPAHQPPAGRPMPPAGKDLVQLDHQVYDYDQA